MFHGKWRLWRKRFSPGPIARNNPRKREVLQVCSRGEGRPSAIGNLARRREQIENEAVQQTDLRTNRIPAGLAFADHMNRLIAGDRAPNSPEGTKMLTRADPTLDRPVILFQYIVEILHRAMLAIFHQSASLDFGKPDLHLIEPTRIGRSVVEANRGIFLEELENLLGFMGAQVVDDEVNFSTLGPAGHDLVQKTNKLGTGMSGGGLSHDVAGAGVEAPHTVRGCHVENTQSHAVRPGREKEAKRGRSRAWIALFSSTQKTAAFSGGLRYKPMISAAFSSNSGSSLTM
jgi:hypothetical protein